MKLKLGTLRTVCLVALAVTILSATVYVVAYEQSAASDRAFERIAQNSPPGSYGAAIVAGTMRPPGTVWDFVAVVSGVVNGPAATVVFAFTLWAYRRRVKAGERMAPRNLKPQRPVPQPVSVTSIEEKVRPEARLG